MNNNNRNNNNQRPRNHQKNSGGHGRNPPQNNPGQRDGRPRQGPPSRSHQDGNPHNRPHRGGPDRNSGQGRRPAHHRGGHNHNQNSNQSSREQNRSIQSGIVVRETRPGSQEYGSINTKTPLPPEPAFVQTKPIRYGILFFDNFMVAKSKLDEIAEAKKKYDQLNIVIKAEGDMDDPELSAHGKVFAGDAWHLIHERRIAEGWYEASH